MLSGQFKKQEQMKRQPEAFRAVLRIHNNGSQKIEDSVLVSNHSSHCFLKK
jgi:hypothetical protein